MLFSIIRNLTMRKYVLGAIIVVAVACCGYFMLGSSKINDHSSIIPDDATAIIVFDTKTVLEETSIQYKSFVNNTESIGLDLTKPVYLFLTRNGNMGASAKLYKVDELESRLANIRDMNGLTWGIFEGGLCCHDGERVLAMGPNVTWSDKKVLAEMVSLMSKQSSSSEIFEHLNKQNRGFKARFSFEALPEYVLIKVKEEAKKYGYDINEFDIKSFYLNIASEFTNKSASVQFSIDSSNENVKATIQTFKDSLHSINGLGMKYIPENNDMWLCVNLGGDKILSHLNSNNKTKDILDQIKSIFNVEDFINALDGDALVTLGNLDMQPPQIGILAQINNNKFISEDLKNTFKTFGFSYKELLNENDKFVLLATSNAFIEEMINSNYNSVSEGQKDAIFYFSLNLDKTIRLLKTLYLLNGYPEEIISYAEEMDHVGICLTKDELSFTFRFKRPFKDLIKKWTE